VINITRHGLTLQRLNNMIICACSGLSGGKHAFRLFQRLRHNTKPLAHQPIWLQKSTAGFSSSFIYESKRKKSDATITGEVKNPEDWTKIGRPSLRKRLGLYAKLSKSRLTGLVVLTAAAGYAIAPGPWDPLVFTGTALGTMLCSSAANSFNQFMEVPYDSQMSRTQDRVLVRGLLRPIDCVTFGTTSGLLGVSTLAAFVNPLTATLGFLNIFLYAGVYTPSKRYHIANTWIGAVVGAIPPLMGWAACTGNLDFGALTLAAILFSWQFPHFNALSWNYRPDYSRAGYKMMSVTDPALCRRNTLRHALLQIPFAAMVSYLGVANWSFFVLSLPFNVYLSLLSWEFYKSSNSNTARKLFRFTLLHLPVLMFFMIICSRNTKSKELARNHLEVEENG